MKNVSIKKLGGNQYEVEIGTKTEIVDLDGFTVWNDEEYKKADNQGIVGDTDICPEIANMLGVWNKFEIEALNFVAKYNSPISEEISKNLN